MEHSSTSGFVAADRRDYCLSHPRTPTQTTCKRCERPFCADCLVPLRGQQLCGVCKPAALRDLDRRARITDRLALEALQYALVGLVVCGPILVPFAFVRARRALRLHRGERDWPGRWQAITALVLSSLVLAGWVIYFGFLAYAAASGGTGNGS